MNAKANDQGLQDIDPVKLNELRQRVELHPDTVAACAYAIWESEGRPSGRDFEHWIQAEIQLLEAEALERALIQDNGKSGKGARRPSRSKSARVAHRPASAKSRRTSKSLKEANLTE